MLYRKPEKPLLPPGHARTFVVEVPVTVESGPGGTVGDARQAGDNFIRDTLKPALDKLSGGPVTVHTESIRKAD